MSTSPSTTGQDGLVIHLTDPFYHPPCDKTYAGYTAHYCEALKRHVNHIEEFPWRKQWIKKGDHTT